LVLNFGGGLALIIEGPDKAIAEKIIVVIPDGAIIPDGTVIGKDEK
jgi:hypothetical protein